MKRDEASTADGLTTVTLQDEQVWRLFNVRVLHTFAALVFLGSLCLLLSSSDSHPTEELASVKLRVRAIEYSASVETSISSDGGGYTSRVSWHQSGYKPTVISGKIEKEKGDELVRTLQELGEEGLKEVDLFEGKGSSEGEPLLRLEFRRGDTEFAAYLAAESNPKAKALMVYLVRDSCFSSALLVGENNADLPPFCQALFDYVAQLRKA